MDIFRALHNFIRTVCIVIVVFIFIFPSIAEAYQKTIGKIVVHNGKKIDSQIILNVLPIKEGDNFDMERIDLAVSNLRKWNAFENIEVKTEDEGSKVDVHFFLDEAIVIGRVDVHGNYPFIENKIRKIIRLRTGDIYTVERIQKQIERIKNFYQREGYFGTNVKVEEKLSPLTNAMAITFKIKHGDLLRYGQIEVSGNKYFPKGRFVSEINPLRPYHPKRLKDAMKGLKELYRKRGFLKSKINLEQAKIDIQNKKVHLKISVYEGPKVKVSFDGNRGVSKRSLKKVLTYYEEGSIDEFETEESIVAIKKLYTQAGYPNAKVGVKKEELDVARILVKFVIDEGREKRIKRIKFVGNKEIGSRKLKRQMITRRCSLFSKGVFDKEVFDEDIDALKKYYRDEGFAGADVLEPVFETNKLQDRINIMIPVNEGAPTIVDKIYVSGQDVYEQKEVLKKTKLKIGKILESKLAIEDRNRILLFFSSEGYPYAEVRQNIIYNEDKTRADIEYLADLQKKVYIGEILVVGNLLTTEKAIKKAILLKEKKPFVYQDLVESQLVLRRLGTFNSVKIETIGFDTKEDIVHILVKVEERNPFQVDIEAGYSTDESLAATLRFSNANSFGWGKRTGLELTAGQNIAKTELSWIDPRVLGYDVEMVTAGWLQYEDKEVYNYTQVGSKVAFVRHLHRTSFLVGQEIDRNYFLAGSSTAADADSLRDNTLLKSTLSMGFDTRNSFSYPTKGFLSSIGADFFNEVYGQEAHFTKLNWKGEYFYTPFRLLTIANSARFDRIQALSDNTSVPSNELLYMGGDNTVRGFDRDGLGPVDATGAATGGRTRWIYNSEIRLHIWNNFKWGFFYDIGSLTDTFDEISLDAVRHSAGFGLRYVTPVGPIRADYGIKLDRKTGESFGRFHLTFGWVF